MHFFEDSHDAPLVSRARAGDMTAFERLIHQYQRVLHSVAFGMLGDADQAQEVMRVALVRSCVWLSVSDGEYGFLSSTHRLLVSGCLDALKNGASPPTQTALAGDGREVAPPSRRLTWAEQQGRIYAELRQLPPESHAIVILRHVAALSYGETAITLGLPIEAVRSRLYRARQRLCEGLLARRRRTPVSDHQEALLQGELDGVLGADEREAHARLVTEHADVRVRSAMIRELSHFLNALGPVEPPVDLAPQVISHVAAMTNGAWSLANSQQEESVGC